jgi:hypothetical protein
MLAHTEKPAIQQFSKTFYKKLMTNSLNIPEPEKLSQQFCRDLELYPTNEEYFTDF